MLHDVKTSALPLILPNRINVNCSMEFPRAKTFLYNQFIFLLCVYLFGTCLADDSLIDNEYLEQYPFCGKMNYPGSVNGASARAVNSMDDENNYRWVALIVRQNKQKDGSMKTHRCSGSIITDRYGNITILNNIRLHV